MTRFFSFSSTLALRIAAILALAAFAAPASADWELDNSASTLSFVTTKAVNVAEVHHFERLSGGVDSQGVAKLKIDLASVNTAIPIRDERMRKILFMVDRYPEAVLTAQVPLKDLQRLDPGEVKRLTLRGELAIHGLKATVESPVRAVKLTDGALLVSSEKPVLVQAPDVGLVEGIEKLREVAGLPSISQSVAVNFTLHFRES